MKLIMITPRVGYKNPILGFIPGWVTAIAQKVEYLWVITPRAEDVVLPSNVKVIEVGRDYSKGETVIHAIARFYSVLWRILRDEPVDGIFSHMYPMFAIMAALSARWHAVPVVMWFTHTHVSCQLRLAHLLVDRVVTASDGSFNLRSKKKTVLGHGIDVEKFLPRTEQPMEQVKPCYLLTVGRIAPSKHYETILQGVAILVHEKGVDNLRLIVVGDTDEYHSADYYAKLMDIVHDLKIQDVVEFVGAVPHQDILTYYQEADVFISASETGLDKAVLEAMSCGVIPIASLDEFRPLLGDYDGLLMYPPGDSRQLAEALIRIITISQDQRTLLRQEMMERVRNGCSLDFFVGKLLAVFQELREKK